MIAASGVVKAFNDTQVKERFYEINRSAKQLLADPEAPLTVRLAGSPQDIVLRGAAALVLWDQLGVV